MSRGVCVRVRAYIEDGAEPSVALLEGDKITLVLTPDQARALAKAFRSAARQASALADAGPPYPTGAYH